MQECDAYKEREVTVSGSLLPQEYETEYTKNWIIMNPSKTIYLWYISWLTVIIYHIIGNSNHSV